MVRFWIYFEACSGEGGEGTEVMGQQRLIKAWHWEKGLRGRESNIPVKTLFTNDLI